MANPFRVSSPFIALTQGCRLRSNPGLQLANAFGVNMTTLAITSTQCTNSSAESFSFLCLFVANYAVAFLSFLQTSHSCICA